MLSCTVPRGPAAAVVSLVMLVACSPTLNWREVRPPGSVAVLLFPCKPSLEVRKVVLGGARVSMSMQACQAGGVNYGLAFSDVGDPALVSQSLNELRAALAQNLGATPPVLGALPISGMTPNLHAGRMRTNGRFPDGTAMLQEAGLFARGTMVFQATVTGARLDAQATDTFFENIKFPA